MNAIFCEPCICMLYYINSFLYSMADPCSSFSNELGSTFTHTFKSILMDITPLLVETITFLINVQFNCIVVKKKVTDLQLSAMDILAPATMKNAAKCDT